MKAEITVNKNYVIDKIDKRIYGSFIEHLGRAVYEGIYEPDHPTADKSGFRRDVIELVKQLDIPIIRYPGGNFVSGYNWEDGIGDKSKRPTRQELAWESIETNQVGIDEFQEWAKLVGADVMMAVNLGTRGPAEAHNCIEYCNADTDTYYANMRRENGFDKPFGFKTWCLGNEMDGHWQICNKNAEEYADTAVCAAKMMRLSDPEAEFVVCGSSHRNMPTFAEWELTVLKKAYKYIDYISLHQYFNNHSNSTEDFLAKSTELDEYIKSVGAMCDVVKAKMQSEKNIYLSLDEWNVWDGLSYNVTDAPRWSVAPHMLEQPYNFEDALVVGCMMMTIQNNCDRVKVACLAQLVNVIAPIMTEKGGAAWAQTIFYPFMLASKNGRGTAMKPIIKCDTYSTEKHKDIPYLEASVIEDEEKREIVVFAVNRSLTEDIDLDITAENFGNCKVISHTELYCDDLKAVNTKDSTPVMPCEREVENASPITLKKHSWNMIKVAY